MTVIAPARGGPRARRRDFRLLWTGQATGRLGSSVTGVALPLVAVASLDASTLRVALLSAATWLPWLLMGLPAGAWVDRLPRRPMMVACDLTALLLFLSVPAAAWLDRLTMAHLSAVALGAGCAGVFFQTAYQVYLPSLLDSDELAEGNAKVQATEAAAQVGGPGVAGLVTQLAGAVNALLLDAVSYLVSALCLLTIRTREARPDRVRSGTLRQEIAEGLRFVARDPYLRVLTLFSAASNICLFGYQSILVVFLVREVGVAPGMVGVLAAATSLGAVLGAAAVPVPSRRFGSARTMLAAEIGAAPFGLLIPLTTKGAGLLTAVAGGFVIAAGVAAGNVLKGSFRQAYAPRALLGRITVTMQLVSYGTIPLGALLGGAVGTALGVRQAMWITTGGLAFTGLILLAGPLRRRRDLPSQPG
ncbi:MFS transporter [Actinomadura sp. WMMA1423]|uniref:MFS transporter n=1 Tax=Actinomadura sp. WMMA1423 TaxID=2591108 RepID=UPI0011469826|nr:MFS transporter [Actinomadura sp. WMMA1423]